MKITKDMAIILLCLSVFIIGVFGSAISINNQYLTYNACQAANKVLEAKINNGSVGFLTQLYTCQWGWKFKPSLAPDFVEAFVGMGIALPIIMLGWVALDKGKKPKPPIVTAST
jgi:hypothetical protein